MAKVIGWAKWVLAVAVIMVSPVVLILLVPPMGGVGSNVADLNSGRLMLLLLWAPPGLALLRRLARQMPSGQPIAA